MKKSEANNRQNIVDNGAGTFGIEIDTTWRDPNLETPLTTRPSPGIFHSYQINLVTDNPQLTNPAITAINKLIDWVTGARKKVGQK